MEKLYESLLELNKQMCLQGFDSNYTLIISENDFFRFAQYMDQNFRNHIYIEPKQDLKQFTSYKVPGPGGYITVKKI